MNTDNTRLKLLPTSTQEFSKIREEDKLYVDKTDIVWKLANANEDVVFFARPRRFGKTLLVSTLEAYFRGQKELFEGLKIMDLEKEWKQHEVLRFDMSGSSTASSLEEKLSYALDQYEEKYQIVSKYKSVGIRLGNIIKVASQGACKVVVLVDEYDYALQHTLFGDSSIQKEHEACKQIYRDFFAQLKEQDRYLRYIFLTGITKFTHLSLFSVLNNIKAIGYWKQYQGLCGITKEEVTTILKPYVQALAHENEWTLEETFENIKDHYDGYHFCENGMDIYNPFSLINALNDLELNDYWAQSGATKMLMDAVDIIGWNGTDFENIPVQRKNIEKADVNTYDLALFMYQAGYLTIKGATKRDYILGIPNKEVQIAISEQILPRLVRKSATDTQSNIRIMYNSLDALDVNQAMEGLKALVADTPYSQNNSVIAMEEKFQFIVKNAMYLVGCDVQEEKTEIKGRVDLVCKYDTCILIIELKMKHNGGLTDAEMQISKNDYAAPFMAQPKPIYCIALEFDADKRSLTQYHVTKVK